MLRDTLQNPLRRMDKTEKNREGFQIDPAILQDGRQAAIETSGILLLSQMVSAEVEKIVVTGEDKKNRTVTERMGEAPFDTVEASLLEEEGIAIDVH